MSRQRQRVIVRRRRAAAGLGLALVALAITLALTGSHSSPAALKRAASTPAGAVSGASPVVRPSVPVPAHRPPARRPAPRAAPPSFGVGLRVLRLVDPSRSVRVGNGARQRRALVTQVRYPSAAVGVSDVAGAPAAHTGAPFPLIVFGHGFAVTPGIYSDLLRTWTRAGYVVAAPVFPLENAGAPGGPDESDLPNQPADMSLVITRLMAASASASDPLHGLVDPRRVAVSGQSDGGDTALSVAYRAADRDRRVRAAVILSGAEIPSEDGFAFPVSGPPLLATQGTADTINPPPFTDRFFAAAARPKFLLRLLGAGHLPPYTGAQPQTAIVERVSVAFLDAFLRNRPGALARMSGAAHVPGVATLQAAP